MFQQGVQASDMNIELEQEDHRVLPIRGERKIDKDGFVHTTRLDKHFTIGENVDVEHRTANRQGARARCERRSACRVEDCRHRKAARSQ